MKKITETFNNKGASQIEVFLNSFVEKFVFSKGYSFSYSEAYCDDKGFGVNFNLKCDDNKTVDIDFFNNISRLSRNISNRLVDAGVLEQDKEKSVLRTSGILAGNPKDGFIYFFPFERLREDVNSPSKINNYLINNKSKNSIVAPKIMI